MAWKNKDKRNAYSKQYRLKHKDFLLKRNREYYTNISANPQWVEQRRKRNKEKHLALKREVINAYGGCCACCKESNLVFLCIDHTKNNGAEHRKQLGNGVCFYRLLKKMGFPKDEYQCLCWNCNAAKSILGYCPHHSIHSNYSSHIVYLEPRE